MLNNSPVLLIGSLILIIGSLQSFNADNSFFTSSFLPQDGVDSTAQQLQKRADLKDGSKSNVKILSLHVNTNIQYRYAITKVTSRVANYANTSQEVVFSLVVPETAFVSKFFMEIKNKTYDAYVKEKKEAKAEYTQAVASGLAAAHVELSARDSNTFQVSVNVEPQTKVNFGMTYEQLLARTLGRYEHVVNISPGQLVKNMSVTVNILEANNITELEIPELKTSNEITEQKEQPNSLASIERVGGNSATIRWEPTLEQQEKMNKEAGAKGQLIVRYDVDRTSNPDQILVDEGYFVHFYAPPDLPTLNKHAIFVLDLSGSMYGTKLAQLKEAMIEILGDLRRNDYFSIVLFSNRAYVWSLDSSNDTSAMLNDDSPAQNLTFREHVIKVNEDTIDSAKKAIRAMEDHGGTNIIDGVRKGLEMAHLGRDEFVNKVDIPEPIIIFLTDGEPNVEISETNEIIKEVDKLNTNKYQVFSLAFGYGADFNFLRKLSLSNAAFARNIYEAADAALQLRNFYKQVASPLLSNVTFNYIPGQVDFNSTTKTQFSTLYMGSELVVAGRLSSELDKKDELKKLVGNIAARSVNGSEKFELPELYKVDNRSHLIDHVDTLPIVEYVEENRTQGHLERAWAYLYVQQLLEENSLNEEKINASKAKALALSLEYSFVTPLTSLVVVKPNDTSSKAIEQKTHSSEEEPVSLSNRLASVHAMMPAALSASSIASPGFAYSQKVKHHPASGPVAFSAGFLGPSSFPSPPVSTTYSLDEENVENSWSGSGVIQSDYILGTKPMSPDMEIALQNYAKQHNYTLGKLSEAPNVAYQECNNSYTVGSTPSVQHHCKHVAHCLLSEITLDMKTYEPHQCTVENKYLGVCCPDDIQPLFAVDLDALVTPITLTMPPESTSNATTNVTAASEVTGSPSTVTPVTTDSISSTTSSSTTTSLASTTTNDGLEKNEKIESTVSAETKPTETTILVTSAAPVEPTQEQKAEVITTAIPVKIA